MHLEDNGNGTVTDWGSSLLWEQHDENDYGPRGYWELALNYCEELNLAGLDDRRLPNINELTSLLDFTRNDPSIYFKRIENTAFPDSKSFRLRQQLCRKDIKAFYTLLKEKSNETDCHLLLLNL